MVADPVSAGLNHSLELSGVKGSVVVQVQGVEGFVAVETWPGVESLSKALSGRLDSEVRPPHVLELKGGIWKEAVVSPNWPWSVVRWSSVDHVRVVSVTGKEGILELVVGQSSVSILIVSLDEQVNLLRGWENVDGVQARSQLVGVNGSVSWNVEDIESVSKVKVVLLGKSNLSGLDLLLLVAEVLKSMDELILIVDSEDWLSAWRESGWADGSSWSDW